MVGAPSNELPPEQILRFLRDQISAHRERSPKLYEGAVTFAISRKDGLTDFWTLYVAPNDVRLESGVAPTQYRGPQAVIYSDDAALSKLTREGGTEGVVAEGDGALLRAIAPCFGPQFDPMSVRTVK